MSLFYTPSLIACTPLLWVTTTQAGIHRRPLSLDINFTQMCPQRAWAHEWMNTRTSAAAAVAAKPSAWAARRRFHYRPDFTAITAPLVADSGMKCHFSRYLHADYGAGARVCKHAPRPRLAQRNTFAHVRYEDGSREMCRSLDESRKSLKCDRQPILHSAIRHIWSRRLGAGRSISVNIIHRAGLLRKLSMWKQSDLGVGYYCSGKWKKKTSNT